MSLDRPSFAPYVPICAPSSRFVHVRGLRHHLHLWGDPAGATPAQPLLVLAHGWMDVGASFQFMVDALRRWPRWAERPIVAFDWRGFGQTEAPRVDSYFFADYVADLDALLDEVSPAQPVDLLGHSMGANAVMLYGGARPERVRRLINLEGFGLPASQPAQAPQRYVQWLDELKQPARLKDYDSLEAVARRLQTINPRLRSDHAQWLAQHWARQEGERWVINADPAHKRSQPSLYQADEVQAMFTRLTMPVMLVEGAQTLYFALFGGRFSREEALARMAVVPKLRLETLADAGHMVHHDQPAELAAQLVSFLEA